MSTHDHRDGPDDRALHAPGQSRPDARPVAGTREQAIAVGLEAWWAAGPKGYAATAEGYVACIVDAVTPILAGGAR